MLSSDQGKDSPNISSTVDPDKARLPFALRLPLVLQWLQRYLEKHPDDRDVVLKAVTVPKLLSTPASTPSSTDIPGEPAPDPIPSQFIDQEVESNSDRDADQHASPFIKPHDQSSRAVDNQYESLFVDPHDHGSPATQQGGGHGVPPYQAYVEDAEDSSGDSQPSANLDDWIPSCNGDDRQDGWSSGDSQHSANLDDLLPSSGGDDRQDGKLLRQGPTSPTRQQGDGSGVPPYQAYVEDAEDSSGDSQPSANLDDWIPTSDGDDRQGGWSSSDSQHAANLDDLLPSSDRQHGKLLRQGVTSSKTQQSNKSSKRKPNFGDRNDPKRLRRDTSDASQDSGILASLATSPTSPTTPEKACGSRQAPTEHNPSAEHNIAFADLRADLRAKAQMIGDIKTRAVAWHFFNYIESWCSGPTNCSNAKPNPDVDVPSTLSDQRLRELKVGIITQEKTEKSIKSMKIVARVFKRVYLAELARKYKEETKARKAEPKTRSKENLPVLSVKNRYTNVLFPETITCERKQQSKKKGKQLSKKGKQPSKKGKQPSKKVIGPREKAKGKLEYWLQLGRFLAMIAKRYGIGIILLLPKKLTDKDLHKFPRHQIEPFLDYIDILHPGLREDLSDLSALLTSIVEIGLPSKRIVLETYSSDQLSELGNRPLKELFQFCTGIDSQRVYAVAGPPLGQDQSNSTYSEYPRPPAPQGGFIHPLAIDQQVDMAVEESFCSQNGDLSVKPLDHYDGVNTSINSYQLNTTSDMPTSVNNSNFSVQTVDMPQEMGWSGNDQDTGTVNPRDLQLRAA